MDIVINELINNLPFTDEGDLHNYLNVNIIYDNIKGIMKFNQLPYINSILQKYNINKIKRTSMLPYFETNKDSKPVLTKSFTDMPRPIQEKGWITKVHRQ